MSEASISADFPFESRFIEVNGSSMHYVDEGEGSPVLFLHGNPTSSYLWRNIIPHVSAKARCIAPDLIGMGKSDKPRIGYRFFDHVTYVEGFIEALGLEDLTLVVHDWGSALGFHYASRHPGNIRGLAFMESIFKPSSWAEFPPEFRKGFKMFRTPGIGWLMISAMNLFVEKLLPGAIVRGLTPEEHDRYREPYPTVRSRRPIRQWPVEIPIDGTPGDVHEAVASYASWLGETELPKLLLHATPGAVTPLAEVERLRKDLKNTTVVNVGPGLHYIQEDHPDRIGTELASWLDTL